MGKEIKECMWCGEVKKLCDAHIVPRWCYDLKSENYKIIGENIKRPIRSQNGDYNQGILCRECDNTYIGKPFDDKSKIIFDKIIKAYDENNEFIKNNNYFNVKLISNEIDVLIKFALSILWRADLSKNRPLGAQVALGPYNEIIKKILQGDETVDNRFQVIITKYIYDNTINFESTVTVNKIVQKKKRYTEYMINFKGYSMNVKISNTPYESTFKYMTLIPDKGSINIACRNFENTPLYRMKVEESQKYKK